MSSVITKRDEHADDMNHLLSHCDHLSKQGVIHIGAHKGEELEAYRAHGFNRVLFIEANPELCHQLSLRFKIDKNITVYNYAVGNFTGERDFHLHESNNGLESSSLHKMDRLEKIVTSMRTTTTLTVPSITLRDFIKNKNLCLDDYNLLVTDIQGADLAALKSAEQYLENFEAVITEVQLIPLYEGYTPPEETDQHMASFGFFKKYTIQHELYDEKGRFPAWAEVLYLRS